MSVYCLTIIVIIIVIIFIIIIIVITSIIIIILTIIIIPDDDKELFLRYGWPTKGIWPYFQLGPLSEILTIRNLNKLRAGFEPVQNLSLGFVEWCCAVVITTTLWHHNITVIFIIIIDTLLISLLSSLSLPSLSSPAASTYSHILKINLRSHTFLDLLKFQETWNLIVRDHHCSTWAYLCRVKQKNYINLLVPWMSSHIQKSKLHSLFLQIISKDNYAISMV